MEPRDRELLENLSQSNNEINKLLAEHQQFEDRLNTLTKRHAVTPSEEEEMVRLKRLKLQGRDRMQSILNQYRT